MRALLFLLTLVRWLARAVAIAWPVPRIRPPLGRARAIARIARIACAAKPPAWRRTW